MARIHVGSFASPALKQQCKDLAAAQLSKLAARILEDDVDLETVEFISDLAWSTERFGRPCQVPNGRKTLKVSFWEKGARR